ncbi:MAG: PPE family protein [Mycobacterium sp.]|nr:PPE family protein [Mycobacterium sp.]
MDFGGMPPEVNSARMYAGAGAGSLASAAAAWEKLATELSSTATSYRSVVSELTGGQWVGPSSGAMAAVVAPYVSWMNATAAQAQQTASQLGSAVAAYEAAFAATVPPPEIEVNRAMLASLASTNTFGQNTPAIAATESQYSEMWAQDAAAMYGYAGASAAATRLTPFNPPPQTTNQSGSTTQNTAVTKAAALGAGQSQSTLSNVPNMLLDASSGSGASGTTAGASGGGSLIDLFNNFSANTIGYQILSEGLNFDASGALLTLAPPVATAWNPLVASLTPAAPAAAAASQVSPGAISAGSASAGLDNAGLSAGLGEASTVGQLSVPPSWGTSPAIRLAASASPLSAAGLGGVPQAGAIGPGFYGGMPPMGPVASVVNAPRGDQGRLRAGARHKVIPAVAGDGAHEDPAGRWVKPSAPAADDGASSERDELNQLRKAVADVSRQRDVLKRTAATLIREATQK